MIRSDRGSHFADDLIKQFLVSTGTPYNLRIAYFKQDNAIVERVYNYTNDVYQYKICLLFIQRILNSSIHSSTNASPASLLFGNQINILFWYIITFPTITGNGNLSIQGDL